jgi:Peptidase A4 family
MKALATFASAAAGLALAGSAQAGVFHSAASSSNWAGYAVTGSTFTDVKGTWVQPEVTCPSNGQSSYAAFWVGLGGFAGGNGGLEQTGTESDCHNGQPSYSAWYELLPDTSVSVPVTVSPGDTVSAEVSVDNGVVTLTLTDVTNNQTYSTQATPSLLDNASAEWIAEAPSQCFDHTRCSPLPLADFGTVDFSGSSTTANGHVGTISDASWSATVINLGGSAGAAVPDTLSSDGSGFDVAFTPQVTQPQPQVQPRPRRHRRRRAGSGGGV